MRHKSGEARRRFRPPEDQAIHPNPGRRAIADRPTNPTAKINYSAKIFRLSIRLPIYPVLSCPVLSCPVLSHLTCHVPKLGGKMSPPQHTSLTSEVSVALKVKKREHVAANSVEGGSQRAGGCAV